MSSSVGVISLLAAISQRLGVSVLLALSIFLAGCNAEVSPEVAYVKGIDNDLSSDEYLPKLGESIYASKCRACHDYGAAGAPRFGNSEAWRSRVLKGVDLLYTNSITGVRSMPAMGGCYACSDVEIKAAVDHILNNSK